MFDGFLASKPERHDVRAEMATALMQASRYPEALAQFDEVIAAGAADAKTLSGAGSICLLMKRLDRAVDLLGRAVRADPEDIPIRIAFATALARSGDHEHAVQVLESVTRDDPENNRAFFLLSRSLTKLGRTEEARRALERHQRIHEAIMRERMSGEARGHP